MSSTASPAMPAFSYAQAAKGLAPSASQPVRDIKDNSNEQNQPTNTTAKPDTLQQTAQKSSRRVSRTDERDVHKLSKDDSAPTASRDASQGKDNTPPSRRSQQKSSTSSVASPRLMADTETVKDSLPASTNVESLDASTTIDRESNDGENRKSKDSKESKENEDDWEKISIPSSAAADKELKAAPLPIVNIWQQRKEAADAKRREIAAQKTSTSTVTANKGSEDAKRKTAHERDSPKPTNKSHDRNESAAQGSRPASRGEKQETKALVDDTTAWPTPETANTDDRKKSIPSEKPAAQPDSRNGNKPHGKQWVQMPFVPTAKFETQLPTGQAKRGGRANRGGRDGNNRAGHLNNGDRVENAGAMGPPPPREDRGRKNDGNRGGRASSLPANKPRAASRDDDAATARKPSAPVSKDALPPQASVAPAFVPASEIPNSTTTSKDPSRSSSSQQHTGANSPKATDIPISQSMESSTEALAPNATADSTPRHMPERTRPVHANYRSTDYGRSERNGAPRNKEWTREKTENAREKVESWRDREWSGDGPSRGSRNERGRGAYRGRGNNYSANFQGGHPYTSPLPQGGFETSKPQNEPRSRQSSQPFNQGSSQQGRNLNRTQSIPMPMTYPPQNYYGNIPVMQQPGMPALQTDMQSYAVAPQMPMHQGIMSAMPYNDSLSSYAILSLVASQLQYYFSIDNLCKDMFLRKNMDSQGWVLLSVIANFKRIQQLTEKNSTIDIIREVLTSLQHDLEYTRGHDGEERVRRRDGWQDFVLAIPDRVPAAQTDGPGFYPEYAQPHYQQLPHGSGEAMPFVPNQIRSPPTGVNGMYNGHTSPPFSMVPPFDGHGGVERAQMPQSARFDHRDPSFGQDVVQGQAPSRQVSASNHAGAGVNGHQRTVSRSFAEENIYPDEDIARINIMRKIPSHVGDDKVMAPIEPIRSNESQASLPGGQGRKPSEQLTQRLQGLKFGSATPEVDAPAIITKDGQKIRLPDQPPQGHYVQPYYEAREEALQDREQGVEDAMETMYSFWSTFLVNSFNLGMYNEFKSLATEDQERGDIRGTESLLRYYEGALMAQPPISVVVAQDLVDQFRKETTSTRPVFDFVRKAWRNGALNLKSRKRIQDILSTEERTEIERGG